MSPFFDPSSLGLDIILALLLYFVAAPWVAMAIPKAKRPLQLAALGSLLWAVQSFLYPFLYRLPYGQMVLRHGANLLFSGGLAAAVFVVVMAVKDVEGVR